MTLVLESPGKLATSWKFLSSDADGSFWLQIDMFLQMKIAITAATSYVFCAAGMKNAAGALPPTPLELTALSRPPSC